MVGPDGVLGLAIGAALARDGRKVAIISRNIPEAERILVGELLQSDRFKTLLQKLGLSG